MSAVEKESLRRSILRGFGYASLGVALIATPATRVAAHEHMAPAWQEQAQAPDEEQADDSAQDSQSQADQDQAKRDREQEQRDREQEKRDRKRPDGQDQANLFAKKVGENQLTEFHAAPPA